MWPWLGAPMLPYMGILGVCGCPLPTVPWPSVPLHVGSGLHTTSSVDNFSVFTALSCGLPLMMRALVPIAYAVPYVAGFAATHLCVLHILEEFWVCTNCVYVQYVELFHIGIYKLFIIQIVCVQCVLDVVQCINGPHCLCSFRVQNLV